MFQQSNIVYHKGKTLVFFSEPAIKPSLPLTLTIAFEGLEAMF